MGAMTLGIALLFMLLVVDSGRLYLEKRKLQRVADTAANAGWFATDSARPGNAAQ